MTRPASTRSLLFLLAIGIAVVAAIQAWGFRTTEYPDSARMREAAALCASWFDAVAEFKQANRIESDSRSITRYRALIGDDYTPITTTLGALDAKETAANPDFAALVVRLMAEAKVDSGSTVGVILSGSFPSLGIATLAALQTVDCKVVLISSLGASSFGANQPNATWIDLEQWLQRQAGLKYRSSLVTFGAENDRGEGIQEEGYLLLEQAGARCGIALYRPESLKQSIQKKIELLRDAQISLLINIGGNEAAIGKCADAVSIPNGLQMHWLGCDHTDKGVISYLADKKTPFIHMLNIKSLAQQYGIPIEPGPSIPAATDLYQQRTIHPAIPSVALVGMIGLLVSNRVRQKRTVRANSAQSQSKMLQENGAIGR
ncbi:MAG: poly-gamma-glutamate system protein [bacterium]|nr:poly-gamma-glutamate system protein [bacterium]